MTASSHLRHLPHTKILLFSLHIDKLALAFDSESKKYFFGTGRPHKYRKSQHETRGVYAG